MQTLSCLLTLICSKMLQMLALSDIASFFILQVLIHEDFFFIITIQKQVSSIIIKGHLTVNKNTSVHT